MKFSEIHPSLTGDPFVRFFARMDEIHQDVDGSCSCCCTPIPCDTMRSLWIYEMERRASRGGA